jgi:hypothetical protein
MQPVYWTSKPVLNQAEGSLNLQRPCLVVLQSIRGRLRHEQQYNAMGDMVCIA